MDNFEELSIDIDGFKGSVLSDECSQLEVRLSQKKRDLTKLKRDAKGSSRKKCQEYINKVDDLTDKLEKGDLKDILKILMKA